MAKVSFFIYNDAAQHQMTPSGPNLNISNPQIVFRPTFIPSLLSFSVVIGVISVDLSQQLSFRYVFHKKNDLELLVDTGIIYPEMSSDDSEMPPEYRGFIANFDFRNVVFQSEGEYISEVYLNGNSIGEFPIYVKGAEQ